MIGETLSHYRITSKLGAGGMGEVFRARDERLDRDVAIKVLPVEVAQDEDRLARFEREAKALAKLSHPNILAIHEFGEERSVTYAVTELLEGDTLRARLASGPLPWRKAVEIAVSIADGLAAAHDAGLVHRDLKPENVFVTTEGRVKILDFGLAKVVEQLDHEDATISSPPPGTAVGTVLGTVGYMAPEQLRGRAADGRTDIFSLGCVLYEMLTGSRPFQGATPADVCASVLREDPQGFAAIAPTVPPGVETIVLRCLEKRPEERFQSARDLVFALQAAAAPFAGTAQHAEVAAAPDVEPDRGAGSRIRSIAVLPFTTTGGDTELEYLADGLTEGLIGRLGGVAGIDRVIARHSVFRYKGAHIHPAAIGRELGVDAVLVGDVSTRGTTVIIRPELIGTEREDHIWGDRLGCDPESVHQVEESISRGVIGTLGAHLTPQQRRQVEKRHTDHPEAYRLYLRGRHLWNKRSAEALRRSIELYREAIRLDPGFALAYTGISDSWVSLYFNDLEPKSTAFREALPAVLTALDLDDDVAESHVALGNAIAYLGYDWKRGEDEYRRALQIDAGSAEALHQLAHVFQATGRHDESVETMRRALDLEPVSSIFNSCLAQVLYAARRYDEAVHHCQTAIELEPGNPHPYAWFGMVNIQRGDQPAAERAFRQGLSASSFIPRIHGAWGYSQAIRGDRSGALSHLERLEELATERTVDPCFEAWIFTGLGDHEAALTRLEDAYARGATWLVCLGFDPFFDTVRDHPEYRRLLEKLNLLEV